MLRAPIAISHAAYETLWEVSELPLMPPPIAISYPVRSADDGARIARASLDELQATGLADGADVHPDLLAALRMLGKGERRYYAMILGEQDQGRGPLVAVTGSAAVLATLTPERLRLEPVAPSDPVRVLVSRLPPAPPAAGRPLRVREGELASRQFLVEPAGAGTTDADALAELMNTERALVIYLHAERRDASGNLRRCPEPLIAFDIAGEGRWFTRRQHWGGDTWLLAGPASAATLASGLAELARTF